MDNEIEPTVGNWYRHLTRGQVFLVVAVDEDEALVELQHSDGDLEEVSLNEWRSMDLEAADVPDDWIGPMDEMERDDFGFSETRSEGERRGLVEARRSESLHSSEVTGVEENLIEHRPTDEAGESDAVDSTVREARKKYRSRRDAE